MSGADVKSVGLQYGSAVGPGEGGGSAGVRPDGEWTAERVNARFPCSAACATHPRTLLATYIHTLQK